MVVFNILKHHNKIGLLMLTTSINVFYLRKYFVILFACLSVFLLSGNTGCGVDQTRVFKKTAVADFSQMGWLEAYDAFHALMQKQYAFGDWKGIDWIALDNRIRPKVVIAEANMAGNDYITALLEYTRSIPDGHISWNDLMLSVIEPKHRLQLCGVPIRPL